MTERQIKRILRRTERLFGLKRGWLRRIAWIESRMNPKAINKYSGAKGIFQFVASTAAEENIVPSDVLESAVATAKRLRRFGVLYEGVPVEMRDQAEELTVYYLSHQQGFTGVQQILSTAAYDNALTPSRLINMEANFPGMLRAETDKGKAREFLRFWDAKLGRA